MQFARIDIFTLSKGKVGVIDIGLRGTMNQLYLVETANKVRRGMRGRIEEGKIAGGLAYGYDVVKKFDAKGEPVRGERQINESQAEIIRRIHREYAAGQSPKQIAFRLNKEGVFGPSGKAWGASTINGSDRRGYGILNNELYIGQLVWNRQTFIKDPDTGKRVPRFNPEDKWIREKVPEWRVVNQKL
jgi:site-specific DNA recombinase